MLTNEELEEFNELFTEEEEDAEEETGAALAKCALLNEICHIVDIRGQNYGIKSSVRMWLLSHHKINEGL